MIAPLFSDPWFSELSAALAALEPENDWPHLHLGVSVSDAPHGPIEYAFHFGPTGAALEVGSLDDAAVTLVESYATAELIANGASISDLLAEGRVTVRGDASSLVAAQRPLAALSAIFGERSEPSSN
jgi:hypothetical protein